MFSRRNLLGGAQQCLIGLRESRSNLHPSQSVLAKQNARAYFRSQFLSRNHGEPKVCSVNSLSTSSKGGLISWYLRMIEARPVVTKGVTAGIIFTAADICCQMLTVMPPDSYDPIRTLRMGAYGMILSGPTLHYWFNFVSAILPKKDIFSTLKKILMGQTIYGPVMNSTFYSVNAALQGETIAEIIARLKRDMIPTTISGLVYWPLCDFLTFRLVPVRLQPLANNSFAFFWTIYITYMASLQKAGPDMSLSPI